MLSHPALFAPPTSHQLCGKLQAKRFFCSLFPQVEIVDTGMSAGHRALPRAPGVQIRISTDSEPLVFKQKNPHLLHSCPAPRTIPWRKSLLKALPGENHLGLSSPLKHMRFAGRGAEPRAVATGFSGNTDGQSGQRERLCEEMGRGCVEAGDSAWSPDRACRCVWPRRRSRLCAHRGELWRTKPWK